MKPIVKELNRRNLFRYLGNSALMYPVLRTFSETQAFGANNQKRAIFFYFPHGIVHKHFQPTSMGENFDMPIALKPLEKVKKDIVVVTNTTYGNGMGHEFGTVNCMTGSGGAANGSIDTYLGEKMKGNVKLPVLRLGVASTANTGTDSRMSFLSGGAISPMEDNPKKAFGNIFGGSLTGGLSLADLDPNKADKSVLDFCLDDVKSLQMRLGNVEKQKLQIHMDSIRELERRIQIASMPMTPSQNPMPMPPVGPGPGPVPNPGPGPSKPTASCNKDIKFDSLMIPDDGSAQNVIHGEKNFGLVADLQMELMVQALACGVTNVGFLQHSHKDFQAVMNFMGGPGISVDHHSASHHGSDPNNEMRFGMVQAYFMGQYAKLIERLKAVGEGDQSLLYNSMCVAFSEIGESNYHLMENVACVVAGQAGGLIKSGKAIDGGKALQGKVYVSMIQAMGFSENAFGASNGALPGLLG